MRHIALPLYRPSLEALWDHVKLWPRSKDHSGKLGHVLRFLTPLVVERGIQNNRHHPYGRRYQVFVDDPTYFRWWDVYTPTFTILLNRLVDHMNLALDSGIPMDDILRTLGSQDGYVAKYGKTGGRLEVSLADLLL
jgi:hypothetical protein